MAQMTKEKWHRFAVQWKETGTALNDIRRKELEKMTCKPSDADTLLDLGSRFAQPRETNGLVIMQRYFMKWLKQQEKNKKKGKNHGRHAGGIIQTAGRTQSENRG